MFEAIITSLTFSVILIYAACVVTIEECHDGIHNEIHNYLFYSDIYF